MAGQPFTAAPAAPLALPVINPIALPDFPGINAIWGATGRDRAGSIWAGVSADGAHGHSAHLVRYNPSSHTVTDHGDVLGQLARLGRRPPGESQIKIHSKITELGPYLYFTSTDEEGERDDGSAPPRWGSHLWRASPEGGDWEHLLAVPEGLTCAGGARGTVWALGLWNHVLYRHDVERGHTGRLAVGAPGGHMSRNILVDAAGHAYVPRVRRTPGGQVRAELAEFSPALTELGATPLARYAPPGAPDCGHGIIGFTHLANGSIAFTTGAGELHLVEPSARGAARVSSLGWFHPAGTSYPSCLFTWDGVGLLVGLAQARPFTWDWVVYDLARRHARAVPLPLPLGKIPLLYGSDTRDDGGRFYVVGRHTTPAGKLPVMLQLETQP